MPDFAELRVRKLGGSVRGHGVRNGFPDLAIHLQGRHKIVGVDRRFANFMSGNGTGVDFVPTVPFERFYGG